MYHVQAELFMIVFFVFYHYFYSKTTTAIHTLSANLKYNAFVRLSGFVQEQNTSPSFDLLQALYPCVSEPTMVFTTANDPVNALFVGAETHNVCRTAIVSSYMHCFAPKSDQKLLFFLRE